MSKAIGECGSFLVFAGISAVGLVFGAIAVHDPPETVEAVDRNASYEELRSTS